MFIKSGYLALIATFVAMGSANAGDIYEVTSKDGDKEITYRVNFGRGKIVRNYTAFDPDTKKFVYFTLKADETPKPVSTIWDHQTGRKIELFKFEGAKNPLPIIPSIEEMKVCPITGDMKLTYKRIGFFD